MAILGAKWHGCRSWLRPDRLETPIYILLVKSDFKTRLERMVRDGGGSGPFP
ncbi:MAG: hypothetical protein HFI44_00645 [Lachnospiraceae bacterium]|nr:hypothetical protein [Lachnospiraceae bacterium]